MTAPDPISDPEKVVMYGEMVRVWPFRLIDEARLSTPAPPNVCDAFNVVGMFQMCAGQQTVVRPPANVIGLPDALYPELVPVKLIEERSRPPRSLFMLRFEAPSGNTRASPSVGAMPPFQLPPTDQRLLTAPVHAFGPPLCTVNTTSFPSPPA